jgi:inner membrane protein involved in colicin E2 resistance
MSVKRLTAIIIIFFITCAGWGILGSATWLRSDYFSGIMEDKTENLYGKPINQIAPVFHNAEGNYSMPSKNIVNIKLTKDYRKKGLFWQSLFQCNFEGKWEITNNTSETKTYNFTFAFPDPNGTYSEVIYMINEDRISDYTVKQGLKSEIELKPNEKAAFAVTYHTRGLEKLLYHPNGSGRLHNLELTITADFERDFPNNSLSPTSKVPLEDISEEPLISIWKANDLITKQPMGLQLTNKLNPGPLVSRITFFGPVCLIFFFVLIAVIDIVKKVGIHPMHYLFVSAGFFAFHLLFSYLVDQIDIQISFWLAASSSVLLVILYLKAALNKNFPWLIAAIGQTCFLVLFSYSFFLKGTTGLTVAIGSVLTLAIIMKVTANINWEEVFSKKRPDKNPVAINQ